MTMSDAFVCQYDKGGLKPQSHWNKDPLRTFYQRSFEGEMELFLQSGIGPRYEKWATCNTTYTFLSPDHQFMIYLPV